MNESCHANVFHLKYPAHRITLSVLYILFSLPAVIFNFLIILTIWRTPSLQKPSNILLGNLAVTDFIVGIMGNPLIAVTNIAALENWVQVFCNCWIIGRVVGYWLGSTSLYTLTVISIDRLLAILLKNKYRTVVTLKRVIVSMVLWWVGAGTIMLSVVTATEIQVDIYIPIVAAALFTLLATITICYALSFYNLKKVSSPVIPTNTTLTNGTNSESTFRPSRYRKLLNTMIIILLTMFLFYTPYILSAIAVLVTYRLHSENPIILEEYLRFLYRLMTISELFVGVNSAVNPLLYLWRMKNLRESVYLTTRMICRVKDQRSFYETSEHSASNTNTKREKKDTNV